MTPTEKQILKNQLAIIRNTNLRAYACEEVKDTEQLLNPKQTEESACDMEENAIRGRE